MLNEQFFCFQAPSSSSGGQSRSHDSIHSVCLHAYNGVSSMGAGEKSKTKSTTNRYSDPGRGVALSLERSNFVLQLAPFSKYILEVPTSLFPPFILAAFHRSRKWENHTSSLPYFPQTPVPTNHLEPAGALARQTTSDRIQRSKRPEGYERAHARKKSQLPTPGVLFRYERGTLFTLDTLSCSVNRSWGGGAKA